MSSRPFCHECDSHTALGGCNCKHPRFNNRFCDRLGKTLAVGDKVVYGMSNRHNPINHGVVIDLKFEHHHHGGWRTLAIVLGEGNKKVSTWLTCEGTFGRVYKIEE